ncbi:MAG TPA: MAPEG family protein [Beijerinckiaceae bacterium]|nr:MAPEG family protein [Beijerinckiaceae bacterium]
MDKAGEFDGARQRSVLFAEVAIAFPVTIALWIGVYYFLPPIAGMTDPLARFALALKLCCVAILFCFLTGIEAVAHERLRSAAIDPLSGYETRRMKINLRYLQHTLEQLALFVPGLFALAFYCSDGRSMRAVVATTVVWIATRFAFWIGYHYGSQHRAVGAPGMMQSMLVLLYVCARFGFEIAGPVGALTPLVLFGCIEAFLVRATKPVQP